MMRRHHLIEEAKTELDVAYEEVKRAEQKIMDLEYSFNEKFSTLEPASDQGDLQLGLTAEKEQLQSEIDIAHLIRAAKVRCGPLRRGELCIYPGRHGRESGDVRGLAAASAVPRDI